MNKKNISVFLITNIILFELPKLFYIINAIKTGIYYPFPYVAHILNINPSNSYPFWILIHWFVGNMAILSTISTFINPFDNKLDNIYFWSHCILFYTIIINLCHLGNLHTEIAIIINGIFSCVVAFSCLSGHIKKEKNRLIVLLIISFPLYLDVITFIISCIILKEFKIILSYVIILLCLLNIN